MNDLISILIILSIIFIQGLYDFIGWKVILGDGDTGRPSEKVFRVIKFILDFPVTIYLMIFVLQLSYTDLTWFYILKWFHSCDRVYNWYDKIFYKSEASYWGYWRWWTFPLGIIRTNWFNIIHIRKGCTYKDYILHTGQFGKFEHKEPGNGNIFGWPGMRGMVNIYEVNNANNISYILFIIFYAGKFLIKFIGG